MIRDVPMTNRAKTCYSFVDASTSKFGTRYIILGYEDLLRFTSRILKFFSSGNETQEWNLSSDSGFENSLPYILRLTVAKHHVRHIEAFPLLSIVRRFSVIKRF